jgi:hypothetical protein
VSESDFESGEENVESGRNPTQRRLDADADTDRPVDDEWETESPPHEGEEGQQPA